MKTTVNRDEIKQMAAMLTELETWERMSQIAGEYNQGELRLSMKGNAGCHSIGLSVDRSGLAKHKTDTPLNNCHRGIGLLCASAAEKLVVDVVSLIKSHMPIEVEC
jgi:hypothetical protein